MKTQNVGMVLDGVEEIDKVHEANLEVMRKQDEMTREILSYFAWAKV